MNVRVLVPLILALVVVNGAAVTYVLMQPAVREFATAPSRQDPLPTRRLEVAGVTIQVEVVSSQADVRQGLSDRPSMPRDRGMLFELGVRDIHAFWMNRMHFPLDIIWIDGDTVAEIAEHVPAPKFGEIPYTHVPKAEADRVLELNAGVVAELGLKVGDTIGGLTEE